MKTLIPLMAGILLTGTPMAAETKSVDELYGNGIVYTVQEIMEANPGMTEEMAQTIHDYTVENYTEVI